MKPADIIMKKRLGKELSREEIALFVKGTVDGSFDDGQLGAMLMAICLNGMSDRETVDLTLEMAHSGEVLDLSSIEGVKADKHSTGGVGDTTTLIVAPLVAACGVKVAKMSGRGLGFTGGTLDKLESIPGMRVDLPIEKFMENVRRHGIAVIGQTASLAPADKTLYALRDVTATVECAPLIISSILSKKIAAGCDVVVLDVKYGNGAMMKTAEEAEKLARDMVRIGSMTGKKFSALVTGMEQPLGMYVGNALEVEEAIDVLAGRKEGALKEVSIKLAAQILAESGVAAGEAAEKLLREKLESGEGIRKLGDMIRAQGGDPEVLSDTGKLPKAPYRIDVLARESGYAFAMDTPAIGNAAKALGAGRAQKSDVIDPAVGVVMHVQLGDFVEKGMPIATLHAGDRSDVQQARSLLENMLTVSHEKAEPAPRVKAQIRA